MSYIGRSPVTSTLGDITGNTVAVTGTISGHLVDQVGVKTSTYVVTTNDDLILANGTFTVTLFTAVGNIGRMIEVRNIGTGAITVAGNVAELIDAANTKTLAPGQALIVKSDNTQWWSVSTSQGWTLVATQVLNGATQYDFIGLSAYSDIRVGIVGVTYGSSSNTRLRVSTDNGGTFLSASGDYIAVAGDGTPTNGTELQFMSGSATAARAGEIWIAGFNLAGAVHFARSNLFSTDGIFLRYVSTTSALNAVRVYSSAGANFTGGTAYVYGR